MNLPQLYKTNKNNSVQTCIIFTKDNTLTVRFGQLDGKMQEKTTTCIGKNIGKANETTPTQQAEIEAQAKWEKKKKTNYSESIEAPVTKLLPRKVHKYQDHSHKLDFEGGVFESPKLNGINAEYRLTANGLKHYSRGGEEYPIPTHQKVDILSIMTRLNTNSLNGEQYIHGKFLQDIQSAVTKTNELSSKLEFHIFDLPEINKPYEEVRKLLEPIKLRYVKGVPSYPATSLEEIEAKHKEYVAQGYEGLMAYNAKGIYEYNVRTYDVLKLKKAQDAEFKILSYFYDKNDHPVFWCQSDGGEFKAKPKGTDAERKAISADDWIGQWMKVEFEMLSKDGKPQKPVGLGLRKCDKKGKPLE